MYGPILSVRGGHEVGIVKPTSILCICNHSVAFCTASLKVELLEVASKLGETVTDTRSVQTTKLD